MVFFHSRKIDGFISSGMAVSRLSGYPREGDFRLLGEWEMDIGINEEDLNQLLDFSFVIFYSSIPYL